MNASLGGAPVLIAAGGTGGHVFPALVVAEELMAREIPVIWIGTRKGIESRVVPAAGIKLEWMNVEGLRGKSVLHSLIAPLKLIRSLVQSLRVLSKYKPRAVLGMGGFVTGPVGIAAKIVGRPLVLHEQNAVPGLTNRLLSRFATRVLQAFPGSFAEKVHAETVGNPVRGQIGSEPRGLTEPNEPVRILVIGGSLGAKYFNENLPQTLSLLGSAYSIWHQTGKNNAAAVVDGYRSLQLNNRVRVDEFIEEMGAAYQWADLIVCRSGAMTVSEVAASGLPAVLVPFPHAVDDHQTANAMFLVRAGAAKILQQKDLTPALLAENIKQLGGRAELRKMGENARSVASPDAGKKVTDILLEVAA
ncbi:MAG: undecaprenyldiphospho-muramoylpentapeptide beta-N-acetylglucosaminyltransferase [Gammaproteobacteria bacterium]|nr:undecaprenyldiphospho-muramoylpentapeptide beta-N-acetylglucosaminyltransferase [Gammaproteobacteria bacterium]